MPKYAKWFTSCLLKPINQHLDRHRLMETEQRGARSKCSGTTDNLLIDRMVCQDSHNAHKNLSMGWIDVRKAFDSVSHEWLQEIMSLHKFAGWICRTVERLCRSWNTRIFAHTKKATKHPKSFTLTRAFNKETRSVPDSSRCASTL